MWTTLKAAIAAVIRTNNNQEITGAVLQNTLNSIVNSVGANATFAGVAVLSTNPGTPDGPVFWIAKQAGTYLNFNRLTAESGYITIFLYNSNSWSKLTVKCAAPSEEKVNRSKLFKMNILLDDLPSVHNKAILISRSDFDRMVGSSSGKQSALAQAIDGDAFWYIKYLDTIYPARFNVDSHVYEVVADIDGLYVTITFEYENYEYVSANILVLDKTEKLPLSLDGIMQPDTSRGMANSDLYNRYTFTDTSWLTKKSPILTLTGKIQAGSNIRNLYTFITMYVTRNNNILGVTVQTLYGLIYDISVVNKEMVVFNEQEETTYSIENRNVTAYVDGHAEEQITVSAAVLVSTNSSGTTYKPILDNRTGLGLFTFAEPSTLTSIYKDGNMVLYNGNDGIKFYNAEKLFKYMPFKFTINY